MDGTDRTDRKHTASAPGTPGRRAVLSGGAAAGIGIGSLLLPHAAAASSTPAPLAPTGPSVLGIAGVTGADQSEEELFTAAVRVTETGIMLGTDRGRLYVGVHGAGTPPERVTTLGHVAGENSWGRIRSLAVAGGRVFVATEDALRYAGVSNTPGSFPTVSASPPISVTAQLVNTATRLFLATNGAASVREVKDPGGTPTLESTVTLDSENVGAGFVANNQFVTCAASHGEVLYLGTTSSSALVPGWLIRIDLSGETPVVSGLPMTLAGPDHRQARGLALDAAGARAYVTASKSNNLSVLPVTLAPTMALTGAEATLSTASGVIAGPTVTDGVHTYVADGRTGSVLTVHKVRMSDLLKAATVNLNQTGPYMSMGTIGAAVADGTVGYFGTSGDVFVPGEEVPGWQLSVSTVRLDTLS